MTTGSSLSAGTFVFARLNIPSLSAGLLLFFISNMTKLFYIRKPVNNADNITTLKTLKDTKLIAGIRFSSLDEAWQYMLGIPDPNHRLEVAEDVAHQQILSAENIGSEHKPMAKLFKKA